MSKMISLAVGTALGLAISLPLFAADTPRSSQPNRSAVWSDSQIRTATAKCNGLTGTEAAKCVVNIRPAGGGGSSLATGVADSSSVKSGAMTEEEFTAALKACESKKGRDQDRCVADVKDHFGRM